MGQWFTVSRSLKQGRGGELWVYLDCSYHMDLNTNNHALPDASDITSPYELPNQSPPTASYHLEWSLDPQNHLEGSSSPQNVRINFRAMFLTFLSCLLPYCCNMTITILDTP